MKNALIVFGTLILAAFLYLFTLKGIGGNIKPSDFKNNLDQATRPFELSPERARFALTMALAKDKSFALGTELGNAASPDVGVYNGKFYIFVPPGLSLLAYPFYVIGQHYNMSQLFAFASISLFALLNIFLIYFISRKIFNLNSSLSIFAGLVFAFGSSSWTYAVTLYQHHVTTFLVLSSFIAAWNYAKAGKLRFLAALYIWIALGVSIWIDYPNAIFFIPVMVYFLFKAFSIRNYKNKLDFKFDLSIIITSLAFFFLIGLHGYYNQVNFGSFKRLSGSLEGIEYYKKDLAFEKKTGKTPRLQSRRMSPATLSNKTFPTDSAF